MNLRYQIATLFILMIPIASIAWTVTHEEVFREPREFCQRHSQGCRRWYQRKFFYLFTCEYCFSHYVTLLFIGIARFQLLYSGWRGYLIAFFACVWIANLYMSIYARLRLDIKGERVEIAEHEHELEQQRR